MKSSCGILEIDQSVVEMTVRALNEARLVGVLLRLLSISLGFGKGRSIQLELLLESLSLLQLRLG